jgi:hypothetical protein
VNDVELRCHHCKQLVALTTGPAHKLPCATPPHFMHRGYIVEFAHAVRYICQPCLNASTRIAMKRATA